ncbi:MAG: hypothetical protein IKW84_00425 [Bacteroidaceae bacterium]|nr:hypothetical protein [Bacteroidaceae bacterium]
MVGNEKFYKWKITVAMRAQLFDMAGAEEFVLRLRQVDPGFESVGLSCVVDVCMVSKRSELKDGGVMDGLIAWEDHVRRIDV